MKNCLLISTALLTTGMFITECNANKITSYDNERTVKQEDSAEKPQLTITGEATVHSNFGSPHQTYYSSNPKGYEKTSKDTSMTRLSAGETSLGFKAKGRLNNGVNYGAEIEFDAMKGGTEVDKMYIVFSKDNFGTIQAGNVKGPDSKCIYSGQQLIGGACGMDGTVPHDFDFATGVISPINMIGYAGKATKVVYYSPRVYGFQLATSITPDTKQYGHNDKDWHAGSGSAGNDNGMFIKGKGDHKPTGRNNMTVALTHVHEFHNGLTTKLSGIYLFEDTKNIAVKSFAQDQNGIEISKEIKLRNARSYQLSATIEYGKWAFGVGYLNSGKSRTPKELGDNGESKIGNFLSTEKANAGRAWNIGTRYKINDDWTVAGVFHKSKRKVDEGKHTRGDFLTFTVDYKVVDGLVLFFEFDNVRTKSCETACERYNRIYKNDQEKNAVMKQRSQLYVVGAKVCF